MLNVVLLYNVKNGNIFFPGYQRPSCQVKRENLNMCIVFRDGAPWGGRGLSAVGRDGGFNNIVSPLG